MQREASRIQTLYSKTDVIILCVVLRREGEEDAPFIELVEFDSDLIPAIIHVSCMLQCAQCIAYRNVRLGFLGTLHIAWSLEFLSFITLGLPIYTFKITEMAVPR
jgi:hypothetical protein